MSKHGRRSQVAFVLRPWVLTNTAFGGPCESGRTLSTVRGESCQLGMVAMERIFLHCPQGETEALGGGRRPLVKCDRRVFAVEISQGLGSKSFTQTSPAGDRRLEMAAAAVSRDRKRKQRTKEAEFRFQSSGGYFLRLETHAQSEAACQGGDYCLAFQNEGLLLRRS